MASKKTPWDSLKVIRSRITAVLLELKELREEEIHVRVECQEFLGIIPGDLLTRREATILDILQKNPLFSNKQIASTLDVSERTVKFHISSLLSKFAAKSRLELVTARQEDYLKCVKVKKEVC